jgi:hypothetical protein
MGNTGVLAGYTGKRLTRKRQLYSIPDSMCNTCFGLLKIYTRHCQSNSIAGWDGGLLQCFGCTYLFTYWSSSHVAGPALTWLPVAVPEAQLEIQLAVEGRVECVLRRGKILQPSHRGEDCHCMCLATATARAGVQPVGLDSADTYPEYSTATSLKGKR